MSYSFSVRGATKQEVLEAVNAKMDEVVAQQPVHAADQAQAKAAAATFVDILPELSESLMYSVSVNGSLGGVWESNTISRILSANITVSVSLVARE